MAGPCHPPQQLRGTDPPPALGPKPAAVLSLHLTQQGNQARGALEEHQASRATTG